MISAPITEQIPIRLDENGRWRVGQTRVLLDLVIYAFRRGGTPESIIDQYDVLSLEDVYLALGYYLRHREELDAYLRQQEQEAEALRREIEANQPPVLTREILLARLEAKKRQQGGT
ncbi:MAG: DUF433 domain-containing protein [Anaerolineae bacterium]